MLKKIVIIFILVVIIIATGVLYYKNEIKEQKINNIMDQFSLTLNSKLKSLKMDDLKIALILSKNKQLVDALENNDENLGYQILSDITTTIKKDTNILIRAQIITKELNIFARSWVDIYSKIPIGNYRNDLKYFQTHKEPRASIEIGKKLGIRATVPIYKNGILLGFIEVISYFKSITEFFSSMGVDIYVLLDMEHIDTAVLMKDNLTVNGYIVSNENYNFSHIQTLNKIDFEELKLNNFAYKDDKYIFYEKMYNGKCNTIGAFVFVLPQKYIDYFRNPENDISFFINVTRNSLYNVEKEEKYGKNVYDNFSATSMIYLQDVINKEDRQVFFDEAYEKLNKYSKDELIQMMLERKVVKKINGKIR